MESGITLRFLHSLNTAIDQEIAIARELLPTLSIDSETNDFAREPETRAAYRQQIIKRSLSCRAGQSVNQGVAKGDQSKSGALSCTSDSKEKDDWEFRVFGDAVSRKADD
jgi:hypothetical protein